MLVNGLSVAVPIAAGCGKLIISQARYWLRCQDTPGAGISCGLFANGLASMKASLGLQAGAALFALLLGACARLPEHSRLPVVRHPSVNFDGVGRA